MRWAICVQIVLIGIGARADVPTDDLSSPNPLIPSLYRLIDSAHYRCKEIEQVQVKGDQGETLALVCPHYYKDLLLEGSGLAPSFRNPKIKILLNVVKAGRSPTFTHVDRQICPYGMGVRNRCLLPFMTIAADRSHYRVGDIIYVPRVAKANIPLPNGERHPGFFVVSDVGGNIRGHGRFDFYVGNTDIFSSQNPFFALDLGGPCRRGRTCDTPVFHEVRGASAEAARRFAEEYLNHLRQSAIQNEPAAESR